MNHRTLKIAMVGTRGIPANYGGFETCVEEISTRLAKYHHITVYCRTNNTNKHLPEYKNIFLKYYPSIHCKSLETLIHTFICALHILFTKYDVIFAFNIANTLPLSFLRLFGKNIILNTDGLEWKRSKWGTFAKKYFLFNEWLASRIYSYLISDSKGIQKYYKKRYKKKSTLIAYGAYIKESNNLQLLKNFNLEPNEYFLQITRFEPENNPLLTIQSYKTIKTTKKLVLIGGNKYTSKYLLAIQKESENNPNIILLGFIYNQEVLFEIWTNCFTYIHGNEVGGTNPALLQAMACKNFVIARKCTFNKAILGNSGKYYSKNISSLTAQIQWTLQNEKILFSFKKQALEKIKETYNWTNIAAKYNTLAYRSIATTIFQNN